MRCSLWSPTANEASSSDSIICSCKRNTEIFHFAPESSSLIPFGSIIGNRKNYSKKVDGKEECYKKRPLVAKGVEIEPPSKKKKKISKRENLNECLLGKNFCLDEDGVHLGSVCFEIGPNGRLRLANHEDALWLDDYPMALCSRGVETGSNIQDEWQHFQVVFEICSEYIEGTFSVKVGKNRQISGQYTPKENFYDNEGNEEWTRHQFQLVEECSACQECFDNGIVSRS